MLRPFLNASTSAFHAAEAVVFGTALRYPAQSALAGAVGASGYAYNQATKPSWVKNPSEREVWYPGLPRDPRLDDNSRWPAIIAGTAGVVAFGTALGTSPGFRKAAWQTTRVLGAAAVAPMATPFVVNKWIGQGLDALFLGPERRAVASRTGEAGPAAKRLRPSRIVGRNAWKLGNKIGGAAGRHPIIAGALVLGGLAAVSAGAKGIEHTANMAQQSSLIANYQNQQHQGLLNMAPGSRAGETVAPTFSGSRMNRPEDGRAGRSRQRQVRGGHMGADGNLVFAMHNRR